MVQRAEALLAAVQYTPFAYTMIDADAEAASLISSYVPVRCLVDCWWYRDGSGTG